MFSCKSTATGAVDQIKFRHLTEFIYNDIKIKRPSAILTDIKFSIATLSVATCRPAVQFERLPQIEKKCYR